jgi:hypothetical protein
MKEFLHGLDRAWLRAAVETMSFTLDPTCLHASFLCAHLFQNSVLRDLLDS